ncbi:MAG: hypothetical protein ACREXT_09595, partial [Gammaproteobacteria bacterium]
IDTGAFTLSLDGPVTVLGPLLKEGSGVLELNGLNTWVTPPFINSGTLRGNAASLATDILAERLEFDLLAVAWVEFDQTVDGIYGNRLVGGIALIKSGAGDLSLDQPNPSNGGTSVVAGTLRLGVNGRIGKGGLDIASGAGFDLSAARTIDSEGKSQAIALNVGRLQGGGEVVLGANRLITAIETDTTFDGVISGSGGLTVNGDSYTNRFQITQPQTYVGTTVVDEVTLA